MSNQITPVEPRAALAVRHGVPPQPRSPENPLLLIRRYLRGRYVWAALLGLALSIPCAIIGYLAVPPVYESTGLLRVAPTRPKLIYQNEENQLMPMFDSFVAAQATLVQSSRVLSKAVEDEALRKAGWPAGAAGVGLLARRIDVKAPRGSELIQVSVSHPNPVLAKEAVNAVLRSYAAIEDELNGTKIQDREQKLTDRVRDLKAELGSIRASMQKLAENYNAGDVDALHAAKLEAIVRLQASIDELNLQIARAGGTETGATPQPESVTLDPVALSARDQVLRSLLEEQAQLRAQYDSFIGKLSPTHRTMAELARRIDANASQIAARVQIVARTPAGPDAAATGGLSLDQLKASHENLTKLLAAAVQELKALAQTRMDILELRERADDRKRDLDEASARLEQMQVERKNIETGRVTVALQGEAPVSPSTDRRMPLAAFGWLGGLAVGIGLVWLFGFIRDGYRYVDELDSPTIAAPLLGVIPDLTEATPEEDEQAALSVHHLRTALQLQITAQHAKAGNVITVTSGSAGDGKTHLSLALGISFAMTGQRTLLIDADLVGRALSGQLGLERAPGLSEAIQSETLNGEVHSARPNLWAVPAGESSGFKPEQLSTALISRLLDRAREAFDVVIIDSGPIMGSLEANLASALSDRVLLVVSRGQDPRVVRAALERLRTIGATCAGLVFNRATGRDFARSTSAPMSKRVSTSRRDAPAGSIDVARIMEKDRVSPGGPPAHA